MRGTTRWTCTFQSDVPNSIGAEISLDSFRRDVHAPRSAFPHRGSALPLHQLRHDLCGLCIQVSELNWYEAWSISGNLSRSGIVLLQLAVLLGGTENNLAVPMILVGLKKTRFKRKKKKKNRWKIAFSDDSDSVELFFPAATPSDDNSLVACLPAAALLHSQPGSPLRASPRSWPPLQ